VKEGAWAPAEDDDIYRSACVTRGGEIVNERVRGMVQPAPAGK
jgi:hypothetical protein